MYIKLTFHIHIKCQREYHPRSVRCVQLHVDKN